MSLERNPLFGADDAHGKASSDRASTKRPYRAPELRKLGTVSDLTYTSGEYVYDGDQDGYAS
jgi:hypothetical protein